MFCRGHKVLIVQGTARPFLASGEIVGAGAGVSIVGTEHFITRLFDGVGPVASEVREQC